MEDQRLELWDRTELYHRLERAEKDLSSPSGRGAAHLFGGSSELNRVHELSRVHGGGSGSGSGGGGGGGGGGGSLGSPAAAAASGERKAALGVKAWTPQRSDGGLAASPGSGRRGVMKQPDYAYRAKKPMVGAGGFPLGVARSRTEPRPPRPERTASPRTLLHSRE